MRVAVLIPVLDEEEALPRVLADLPRGLRVLACDNGSTDRSVAVAEAHGAEIVRWPQRGYGGAVLHGIRALATDPPDVVVVLDGDHSFYADDLPRLIGPIERGEADMVLGERLSLAEPGALTPQQVVGNRLANFLIWLDSGHRYLDQGPFRAIRYDRLVELGMSDLTWGWNVEMQMKALQHGLRVLEVPVRCRARIGRSKISGTVGGVLRAGAKITYACWKYRR
ncbi:MAG: glycosyltransferase family 2 protein [Deltaproteobacteria bacterium]|nr:glycosyltransferase family 2 protein [Deltaproteobacteria bacterium]